MCNKGLQKPIGDPSGTTAAPNFTRIQLSGDTLVTFHLTLMKVHEILGDLLRWPKKPKKSDTMATAYTISNQYPKLFLYRAVW